MDILKAAKEMSVSQNVSFRIYDQYTGKLIQEHIGHNCATNSALVGIAHYLVGDGVLNQGTYTLSAYVPRYISLGTMGLYSQDEDENGLPAGVGVDASLSEESNFKKYMEMRPGYGADGYDVAQNNNRPWFGLGPVFAERVSTATVDCELISEVYPRSPISFRELVPERKSEQSETIDVVFSAMISTGALRSFRESDKDYIYITEAGLWSTRNWDNSGDNGLLAGYRIAPPNKSQWDMTDPANRDILKQNILRVGINQVVQIIWKIQLGSVDQFPGALPENGDHILYPLNILDE